MAEDFFPQTRLGDRLEEMDKSINAWRAVTRKSLQQKLLAMGVNDKIKLAQARRKERLIKGLRSKLGKKDGEIERVAFVFLRHGIFLQRGVGSNRPVGSAKARQFAKPWITETLPQAIEDLANLLENEYADIAAAELNFNIPGVMSSKITRNG